MTMISWCAAIASLLFASMAYAQADTPVVDQRQAPIRNNGSIAVSPAGN